MGGYVTTENFLRLGDTATCGKMEVGSWGGTCAWACRGSNTMCRQRQPVFAASTLRYSACRALRALVGRRAAADE